MLRNRGIELTRSTLCGWVGQCVGLVRPIYAAVVRDILGSKVLHTDDTPVRVLEPGQGKARLARLWAYVGDRQHYQVAYQFTLTREQKWAKEFLGDWKGYLQADAYPGYGQLYTGGTIIEVGCWAHVRRKFFDAQDTNKTRALLALAWIGRLYGVEKEARTLSSLERRALRLARSKPILEEIKAWLDGEIDRVPPRSPIAQAMQYARGQWGALVRYLEDGDLDIDNNECERLIRGCCVGRKNYLFFGSEGGGEWGAVIYTLVESAKLNGHDPFAYLKDVLVRVGAHPMRRIDELMPRLWKPPPNSS
jgi:transposase